MTPLLSELLLGLAVAAGLMTCVWIASVLYRDASLVDRFWGLGFVAVAWAYHLANPADTVRKVLVVALVTLWGLRLSGYLTWRNWGEGEDYRYREMREKHGDSFRWISLFTVFLLQGALLWLISWPLLAAQRAPEPQGLIWLDVLGLLFFAVGFLFEAGGDYQMARFKADPSNQGEVLDSGFWRYTRHPNYFGDAMQWWGFTLFALATGAWWTLVSPILMTFLLLKVSGVALLEKKQRKTKSGYEDYVERTNAFFPWFPEDTDS